MKTWHLCAWILGTAVYSVSPQVSAQQGQPLLEGKCSPCHARSEGGLLRIKDSRRTPEGWDMTVVRMMLVHGVKVNAAERASLVKYLADTRGLAPEETRDRRYLLERRPNMVEQQPDATLAAMCARCHSYGRFALQRRTQAEWLKLSHFHMGQFPTIEYQALGRDRNWWDIARDEVPPLLAKHYPLETAAWSKWQSRAPRDLSGNWRVVGNQPGRGAYHGALAVKKTGEDTYSVAINLEYTNGSSESGTGNAIVYTGYEWRASVELGGKTVLLVGALDEDANRMSGRWFYEENDAIGATMSVVRSDGEAQILDVQPSHMKLGESGVIRIHGTGLSGQVALGEGVEVVEAVSSSAETIVVKARVAEDARTGARTVKVGSSDTASTFVVYDAIDSIAVEPKNAIARVGGGALAGVPAQFDAVAYLDGADGKPGTEDDIRIGVVPATWSIDNATEVAAKMNDDRFAGRIDSESGLFTPALAGPNPKRPFGTNNVGDLKVKAVVSEGGKAVEGEAHLVVTVQRWNDPPLR